jgi:hypothetical protein
MTFIMLILGRGRVGFCFLLLRFAKISVNVLGSHTRIGCGAGERWRDVIFCVDWGICGVGSGHLWWDFVLCFFSADHDIDS